MKKRTLTTLALIGISMGVLLTSCGKESGEEMNEETKTFYEQLTPDAQKRFLELDQEHRKAAMQIMEQSCKGENQCRGQREQAVEEQYTNQMQQRQQMKP